MTTPSRSYASRVTSALADESDAERRRRNGLPPAGTPAPAPHPGPPEIKGAVKVTGFPTRSLFPFAQIAADGGVWKLDPAAFTWRGKPTKPQGVCTAARKYATDHALTVKAVTDDGYVYVQFTKRGA